MKKNEPLNFGNNKNKGITILYNFYIQEYIMFDMLRDITPDSFLSPTEAEHFRKRGYLHIKNAISDPSVLDTIESRIDRFDAVKREEGVDHRGTTLDEHKNAIYFNFIDKHKLLIDLITWPSVFHKVWGLLGWNTFCFLTNLIVSPPDPKMKKFIGDKFTFKEIHRDGGRQTCEAGDSNLLALKVAYFFSDCTNNVDGNLSIIPGSHKMDLFDYGAPQNASKEANDKIDFIDPTLLANDAMSELVPIKAKRGDAFIFDSRLWHTRAKNVSNKTRKVVLYGYSYRWTRGFEYYNDSHRIFNVYGEDMNAILRQMLDLDRKSYDAGQFVDTPLPLQDFVAFLETMGLIKDGVLV